MVKMLILSLITVSYLGIFQLPYAVWTFPLTQNWFTDNGLILFHDIIWHHTPLPLFILYLMSKFLGNTAFMLQASSFLLSVVLGIGIYLLGKQISRSIGIRSLIIFLFTFSPMFNNFNIEEMIATLFTVYATYFFIKFFKTRSTFFLLYSGLCVGLGFMGKQAAIGILPAFLITFLLNRRHYKNIRILIRYILFFLAGIAMVVVPILTYYLLHNALNDFFYWNIIFNLTVYPSQSKAIALSEGLSTSIWLFLGLTIGIIALMKKQALNTKFSICLMIFSTIFLAPALLPSFHMYKILLFYPYPIILWALCWEKRKEKIMLLMLFISFILFLPIAKSFYIDYVPKNIFHNDYILEYGENELKVVEWIKKNTNKNERIMNLGHHYITTLSQRLPKNRYVYIFPWLVMPYEASTKEILSDPPRVIIVDEQVLTDWPVLKQWGFIHFVKANYRKKVSYGTYEIYTAQ